MSQTVKRVDRCVPDPSRRIRWISDPQQQRTILAWESGAEILGKPITISEWTDDSSRGDSEQWGLTDALDRIIFSKELLSATIIVDSEIRSGVPVLVGTRFPIARLFSEVAAGRSLPEIADDKELELQDIERVFEAFAMYLGRSFTYEIVPA
ncbi:MAG: DUF433 domain-containing protein [Tepidisphaeraceae bacterium]|jgi:uncharacterized protein (DUF433 family)